MGNFRIKRMNYIDQAIPKVSKQDWNEEEKTEKNLHLSLDSRHLLGMQISLRYSYR